jgi:predicted metal-dependent hydrolase
VKGSRLCNAGNFYEGHDEWEEVWRRATGARRRLLHGLIQVAVGYEHNRRGNARGKRSLLRQGAAKLRYFTRRPGVKDLRDRALADADSERVVPPKLMLTIAGHDVRAPKGAIRIEVPPR